MERVIYTAKYEVGYRPRSHWEEKDFNTKWEAEKFAEEWRRKHSGGAYVSSHWGGTPSPQLSESLQKQISHTIDKYASRWNGF